MRKVHRWGAVVLQLIRALSVFWHQSSAKTFSLFLLEKSDWVAAESWPSLAAHHPGGAEERITAFATDGGVRASWGAPAHHGQYKWQGLSHYGGPAVCPEHLSCHGLHIWYWPAQGMIGMISRRNFIKFFSWPADVTLAQSVPALSLAFFICSE